MSSHTEFKITFLNAVKMFTKSVFESPFSLAYILDATDLAGDAVDEIGTPTADVFHGRECLVR